MDVRSGRMAHLVVERMLRVRAGQAVLVQGPASAEDLVVAAAERIAGLGARPTLQLTTARAERAALEAAEPAALAAEDRLARLLYGAADALLRIDGGDDLDGLDTARAAARVAGRGPAMTDLMARSAAGELRWAVALHPNPRAAARAGLDEDAFADLVYAAARCDADDPVGAWAAVAERQDRLAARLAEGRELRFTGPGTDLTLRIRGRRWRSSTALRNLPDGEVFTGPIEDSAEGVVSFSYPARNAGMVAEGIRLVFRGGRVVEATAERGQDALDAALAVDAGARRLGEVGIGTNYRLTRFADHTLLDEKIGGTFHLALGRSYPETGGRNASSLHWDIVCDLRQGGEIVLDGETVQRDGRFAGPFAFGLHAG
jgi:aminopeptidase